jgi:hypothetical protein
VLAVSVSVSLSQGTHWGGALAHLLSLTLVAAGDRRMLSESPVEKRSRDRIPARTTYPCVVRSYTSQQLIHSSMHVAMQCVHRRGNPQAEPQRRFAPYKDLCWLLVQANAPLCLYWEQVPHDDDCFRCTFSRTGRLYQSHSYILSFPRSSVQAQLQHQLHVVVVARRLRRTMTPVSTSSLIGVAIACGGNVLISLAL